MSHNVVNSSFIYLFIVKDISEEYHDCVKVIMTAIRNKIKNHNSCVHVSDENFLEHIKCNQELITEILEKNERS